MQSNENVRFTDRVSGNKVSISVLMNEYEYALTWSKTSEDLRTKRIETT